MVQMNPNAAAQVGDSMARLGQQLAQSGQDVADVMKKTVRAEEETTLLKMQIKWKEAAHKQQKYERDNPNSPLSWQEHRAKTMPALEAYNNEQVFRTPEGKKAKEHAWLIYNSDETTRVDRESHTKLFKNRVDVGKVAFDQMVEEENFVGAQTQLDGMKQYVSAEVYANGMKAIEHAEYKTIINDVKDNVNEFSETAVQDIKNGEGNYAHIKKEDIPHMIKYAEGVTSKNAKAQLDALEVLENSVEGLSNSDFDLMIERGELKDVPKNVLSNMKKSRRRSEPTTAEEWKQGDIMVRELDDMMTRGRTDVEIAMKQAEVVSYLESITPPNTSNYLLTKAKALDVSHRVKQWEEDLKGERAAVIKDGLDQLNQIQKLGKSVFEGMKPVDAVTGKQAHSLESSELRRDIERKFIDWVGTQDFKTKEEGVQAGRAKINQLMIEGDAKTTLSGKKSWDMLSLVDYTSASAAPSVRIEPTLATAWQTKSDVPYDGKTAANVRYNNPAASYPSKHDVKFGVLGYGTLTSKDSSGNTVSHKIARFPSPVHGAASNLDLLRRSYVGMTVVDALKKWRGREGTPIPVGLYAHQVIDETLLSSQDDAINLLKQMSSHESSDFEMTDSQWASAYKMANSVR